MRHTLQCDMTKTCAQSVTHIGAKGYVYCAPHSRDRQGTERCRKMTARETRQIANNQPIQYGRVAEPTPTQWAQERGTE